MIRWEYLLSGIIACGAVLALDQLLRTRLVRQRRFWVFLGIMMLCQLIFDGYLTARPVTIYDPCCPLGPRLPLIAMPIEDIPFGLALVGLAAVLWEWGGRVVGRQPSAHAQQSSSES